MDHTDNAILSSKVNTSVQVGTVEGSVHLTTGNPEILIPHQLPPSTRHFVARQAELDLFTALMEDDDASAICVVDGPPGVGKTALAVHWAHSMQSCFPDGQIYVDLHGFDNRQGPVEPDDVTKIVLETLVDPRMVPLRQEARIAQLRSLLYGRRILLLLDDARTSDQVEAVLPGSLGCFTLVTSRERLDGLVSRYGAYRCNLAVLTNAESQQLIKSYVGATRTESDKGSVAALVGRCAGLPMALSVVAARAALEETSMRSLVHDFDTSRSALDTLQLGGGIDSNVRLAFSSSFASLPTDLSATFRALVLHPGRDLNAPAAAAMTDTSFSTAKRRLHELVRRNLMFQTSPDRFGMHDLLRAFGLEHEARRGFRRRALKGLLNHYLHVADRADRVLNSHRRPMELTPCARPKLLPALNGYENALHVLVAEYDNLIAAIRVAAREEWDDYSWQLPWTVSNYAYLTARWSDWVWTHELAAKAVHRAGTAAQEARVRQSLGRAYSELGEPGRARDEYEAALRLLGDDPRGQANALNGLAGVHVRSGAFPAAIECGEKALVLYRESNDDVGQASTLNLLGRACAETDPFRAIEYHQEALHRFERAHDAYGRAQTASALGVALAAADRWEEAVEQLSTSAALHLAAGNEHLEAQARRQLAELLRSRRELDEVSSDAPCATSEGDSSPPPQ